MHEASLPWAIRAATRPDAGGGHVSRCCALAKALAQHAPVIAIVERYGDPGHQRFERAGIRSLTRSDAAGMRFVGVVLDDYSFTPEDIKSWRSLASDAVVQIDDYLNPLEGVDLIINARPGLCGSAVKGVPALLGERYSMLGEPYCDRHEFNVRNSVNRINIGIGLFDAGGITERCLSAVESAYGGECEIDILLGGRSPNASAVRAALSGHAGWRVHFDAEEPWCFIETADLAIAGGGQSLLERLAIGVPTIGLAVADNQEAPLRSVAEANAVIDLGRLDENWLERLRLALVALNDPGRRRALSVAAQRLIDGKGALRVADRLHEFVASSHGREARA